MICRVHCPDRHSEPERSRVFEIRLKNRLTQRAIARECADWIRRKARFRSNATGATMQQFGCVRSSEGLVAYQPLQGFTSVDLGYERGDAVSSVTVRIPEPASPQFDTLFQQIWGSPDKVEDVTARLTEHIASVYKENEPERMLRAAQSQRAGALPEEAGRQLAHLQPQSDHEHPRRRPLQLRQYIPSGSFQMGSCPAERCGKDTERPQHQVDLDYDFWLGRFPATFQEYDGFCVATGRELANDDGSGRGSRPVINVSWEDATAYCDWLSEQTGQHLRLPTESEWEYACRAGSHTLWSFGDKQEHLGGHAWYEPNSDGETHPVGEKRPNDWGLYDMHGNVWEWVQDSWHDNYQGAPSNGSAWETATALRVLRGGDWLAGPLDLRAAFRHCYLPDERHCGTGFRLARDPDTD